MARKEVTMSNLHQINNKFIDMLKLELNEIIDKQTTEKNNSLSSYPNNARIKHSEILKILLDNIIEVDFREEAGADEDKEKLKYKDYLVTCSDKLLEAAECCGFGICNSRDNMYLFNGEYWKRVNNHRFYTFLGASANKMGISKNTSKHYSFKEQLMKQLLSVAY